MSSPAEGYPDIAAAARQRTRADSETIPSGKPVELWEQKGWDATMTLQITECKETSLAHEEPNAAGLSFEPGTGPRGEQWETVGNWTQGEKRGRVSGVLSAPLPLLAQEDP
eukprot:1195611-Prorocentrum_minimum.AAC.1